MIRRSTTLLCAVAVLLGAWAVPASAASSGVSVSVEIGDANGESVANSHVALSILPTARLHVTRIPIGHLARTDRHGRAAWQLALTKRERAGVEANGGWLNLLAQVVAEDGRPLAVEAFSIYLGADPSVPARLEGRPEPRLTVPSPSELAARPAAGTTCSNWHWKLTSTAELYTDIGQLHVSADTPTARFSYGSSADSDIDLGYRNGTAGWTLSGSIHIGNATGTTTVANKSSYWYRHVLSRFRYGLWKLYADCYEGEVYQNQQHTEAMEWIGGGQDGTTSLSYWDNRNHSGYRWLDFGPGYEWSRSTNDLSKIAGSVSAFGASLGAQSGASTTVTYYYKFGSRAHHYLYGLTAYPSTAGVIYASDY
jgi:hypothetical protein